MKLAVRILGSDAAPPVVFLGSLGSTIDMWGPQVEVLDGELRVLLMDHRGHGATDTPPGPYTIADLGGDVLETLDDLGIERVHLVGLSLGAMTAMWLAAEHPERVAGTMLLSTSAFIPDAGWEDRAATVRQRGMDAIATMVVSRWLTPRWSEAHLDARDRLAAMVASIDPEGYANCCGAIATMDLRPQLAGIDVPCVVVVGRDDPNTPPEHAEVIAAGIPAASLELIDGAHFCNWDNAAVVNDIIRRHVRA
ncbi:MAG: 3-oxoadipate enol-lactonase [Acidimicrobiia bacterium]|nr:3-oxoadipate enol-lactonase [Acidimicrobiia bacterium]